MEWRPGGKQNSNGNRETACQRRLLHRKPTEQGGQDQRNFGCQARIIFVPTPIGGRSQYDDAGGRNCKQHLTANDEADRTSKRGNGERSYPRRRTRRTLAFAALPFGAD